MTAARWVMTLLVVGTTLSGCAQPDPAAAQLEPSESAVIVPWPKVGAAATYTATDITSVTMTTLRPTGAGDAVRIRQDLTWDGRKAELTEFISSDGRKAFTASPCRTPGHGFAPPEDYERHCGGQRLVVVAAEAGLPGALGTSFLWGRTLSNNTLNVTLEFMGEPLELTYEVRPAKRSGLNCAELRLDDADSVPDLRGQRYSSRAALATRIVTCHGEPFPHAVETLESDYARTSYRGGGDHLPDAAPAKPTIWTTLPAADARISDRGVPFDQGYDPQRFPPIEALRALQESPAGSDFVEQHGAVTLRETAAVAFSSNQIAPMVNGPTLLAVDRRISVQAEDGAVLDATILRRCDVRGCVDEVRLEGQRAAQRFPEPPLSRPLNPLMALANTTFGVAADAISVGVVTRDVGRPEHGTGKELIYRFLGVDSDQTVGGLPFQLRVRGATGDVIYVSAPADRVERLTGVTAGMLR